MMVAEVFRALGEPTRLKIVERLSRQGQHTITSLSKDLNISRQGSRKHIQVLADSKIIKLTQQGRKTFVTLDQQALHVGKKFITNIELQWERRLESLRDFVDSNK